MKLSIFVVIGILFVLLSITASAAEIDDGMRALQSGQFSEALKILVPLANSGNDEAQRVVGEMCYNGQGMNPDVDASFKWTEIAAANGNKIAQYNLGYLYEKGEGVVVSRDSAIEWYTKAAIQGYVAAQHKLGDLSGRDRDRAIYWYKKAGESGDEVARGKFAALSSSKVSEINEATRKYEAEENRQKVEEYEREIKRQAARDAEDRRSLNEYKAGLYSNLQNDINRSWAQAEAGSRGSSIEEDRAKAKRLSDFNDSISRMEADPNSDLNRDKRARERERAEAKRADSVRAAKLEAAKNVALASEAKRANDKNAQADAAANARKKQQADELKVQQDQEKQRLAAELRSQELRDIAERKRVAAAEEAKQKAEKEREAATKKRLQEEKAKADKDAELAAEGRIVQHVQYDTQLEEHQAKTWCQEAIPKLRKVYDTGLNKRNKLLSVGACTCKPTGAVSMTKQFGCEFPYTVREFITNSK